MNFDLASIQQAFATLSTVVAILKQAKDLLPDGPKKRDIVEALEQAERQIKLAESQAAQGLDYQLCKNHFPPEIMLSSDNKHWKCPVCGNERDTSPPRVSRNWTRGPTSRNRKKS